MVHARAITNQFINDNYSSLMSNSTYSIPIVFHVLHEGGQIGQGTNVPESIILQTLQDLNSNFNNNSNGSDVDVEFCLATRKPNSQPTNGINRIDMSSNILYINNGISELNEIVVKDASVWPTTDYINVWIVNEVVLNGNSNVTAWANFPNSSTNADYHGIVIESAFLSNSNFDSQVLTHEMGHFLGLYHTYHDIEDPTDPNCPSNVNCQTDGDMICDTRAHRAIDNTLDQGACNETNFQSCDFGNYTFDVCNNHMNNTGDNCRMLFTEDQKAHMRAELMTSRGMLMSSIGCTAPCSTPYTLNIPNEIWMSEEFTLEVTNAPGATSINWFETSSFPFAASGPIYQGMFCYDKYVHEIRLTMEFPNNCVVDTVIRLYPQYRNFNCTNTPCNYIKNNNLNVHGACGGQFSPVPIHMDLSIPSEKNIICNFAPKIDNPFFCANMTAIGLYSGIDLNDPTFEEAFVINQNLKDFDADVANVCFTYSSMIENEMDKLTIQAYLTENLDIVSERTPSDVKVYELEFNPDLVVGEANLYCPGDIGSHTENFSFQIDKTKDQYLYFIHAFTGNEATIFVSDVTIKKCEECDPNCALTYEQRDQCIYQFSIDSCDYNGNWEWDFGDGTIGIGNSVTHEFNFSGEFTICASTYCGENEERELCQTIIVNEECENCTALPTTLAQVCDQDSSTYMADISFEVPQGFFPCSDQFIISDNSSIEITNQMLIPGTPNNTFGASVDLMDTNGDLEANGTTLFISLCDSTGQVICFEAEVIAQSCTNCNDIAAITLICDINQSNDSVYTYCASISFSDNFNNVISTMPGVNITDNFDGTYEICITTMKKGAFNFSLLFTDNLMGECYTASVIVPEPCELPPPVCDQIWDPKCINCDESNKEGDLNSYRFGPMEFYVPYGSTLCDNQQIVVTDGNQIINIDQLEIVGDIEPKLYFDLEIESSGIDCETVSVKVVMCDSEGEQFCFEFPLILQCGEEECCSLEERFTHDKVFTSLSVYPNPSKNIINLVVPQFDNSKDKGVYEVLDLLGNSLKKGELVDYINTVSLNNIPSGVYLIQTTINKTETNYIKILVSK